MSKVFLNDAEKIEPSYPNYYGFRRAPNLLCVCSRVFQALISQVGSRLLSGKFHDNECGIYKCEGGCRIEGKGDLVLGSDACYFDRYNNTKSEEDAVKMAQLITHVVLNWDPMDPFKSMYKASAEFIKVPVEEVEKKMEEVRCGGAFGGDALTDFFDYNPFAGAPINREYKKFYLVNFCGLTEADVDQAYADQDLGEELLGKINKKIREHQKNGYHSALCCSPRRMQDGKLAFWINTGRSTQIDGWKTAEDIQEFLNSDGIIVDRMG